MVKQFAPVYPYDYIMNFKFPTYEYIRDIKAPVAIFHGTDDWVVPQGSSEKLKPLLKPEDEYVTIPGGEHNNLAKYPVYNQKMDSLLHN
ncbi:alpha/beta hydrolase [Chitinophaga sedimenti]|uniref:alpha/beta fold hydrolase n=1 Tax=Chitinophaga sedimenti TaxID=2033606 RepID=UPI002002F088|nr:alpha/beta hydrolase [Chitinophaga sedimenti]MCK7557635.1 alpha/beta hydrolase [Chitinophaga sedimenti]